MKALFNIAVATALWAVDAGAVTPAEPPLLAEARLALAESVPRVAVLKAERFLADNTASAPQKDDASFLLAQAHLALREGAEALTRLRPLVAQGYPGAALLQARVFAAQSKAKEAQLAFHAVAQQPGAPLEALVGEAESLHTLGRAAEAIALFQAAAAKPGATPLLQLRVAALLAENRQLDAAAAWLAKVRLTTPEEQKWKKYVEGCLLLAREQAAPALTLFEEVVAGREHLPESLYVAATFGATEARTLLYGTEEADKVLETYIWRNPSSPYLARAFRLLDQVYLREDDPPEGEYMRWAQKGQLQRAGFARYYLARQQAHKARFEKAADVLATFFEFNPAHPLLADAYLLSADVHSALGHFDEAERALDGAMRQTEDPATRAEIELRSGLVHYQQGEFLLAATQFDASARRSPETRPVATFDSALSWLALRNFERFRTEFQGFVALQAHLPLRPDLALEEGLARARGGDAGARAALKTFLRQHPQNPRAAEAHLALAELSLFAEADTPRAREDAAHEIRNVSTAGADPDVQAQADYLAIWMSDSQEGRDAQKVINLAREFLRRHPQSDWTAAVRMKLGQLYFNREDYANAETYFTQLAQEAPGSEFAESSLFLAGQAATKLMNTGAIDRALAAFEAVIKRDGPLKLYARQEQAIIQNRLSHEDQAVALYDLILSAEPAPDPQLRQASICGKADNLLALGRREESAEKTQSAIATYDQLVALPEVLPTWRNQALFKKGKALEQLSRKDEAILAYYDVVNRSATGERESFWLYKAGFEAARLFEQQEEWKSAVGICEKMAAFEGPRSAEAKTRAKQLRLDHYLWE